MAPWLLTLVLMTAAPEARRINLDLRDAEMGNVLRLLADVGKVNIVAGEAVNKGKVSVKLTDVPWPKALEVILAAHGLGSAQEGNVILVDTLANLAARTPQPPPVSGERVTILIPVKYSRAAELAPTIKALLSKDGTVTVDARTNSLVITDAKVDLPRIQAALGP